MASTIDDQVVWNENGYTLHYCKTSDGRTYIYAVPDYIDDNTQVVLYVPGTGGAYPDSMDKHGSADKYLSSMMNNHDNCILIVPKDPQGYANEYNSAGMLKGEVDANATIAMVEDVLRNYNMDSSRLTANISWSNGTTIGLKAGIHFLQLEGENAKPKTFMLINSAGYTPDLITDAELQILAASDSNVIIMSENGRAPAIRKYEKWADNYGINMFGINCNNNWGDATHSMGNTVFADNNGLSALIGTTALALPALFTFTKYNSATHEWEDIPQTELAQFLTNMTAEQRASLQASYNNVISENYNDLAKLENLSVTGDSSITSNYSFVVEAMNSIRDKIREQSQELSSFDFPEMVVDNQLLGNVGIYVSNCMVILGSLMDSLTLETEAVVSYAQALSDMDKDLSGDISKISMMPLPDNYSAIGMLHQIDNHDADMNGKLDKGQPLKYGSVRKVNTDIGDKINGEIRIDDYSKLLYASDNDKLTDLIQKFDCSDQEEFNRIYAMIQDNYYGNDAISDISVQGLNILVKFNKSFYEGKNLDYLVQNYFDGGKL